MGRRRWGRERRRGRERSRRSKKGSRRSEKGSRRSGKRRSGKRRSGKGRSREGKRRRFCLRRCKRAAAAAIAASASASSTSHSITSSFATSTSNLLFFFRHHPDDRGPQLGQRRVVKRQRGREVEPRGGRERPAELDGAERVDPGCKQGLLLGDGPAGRAGRSVGRQGVDPDLALERGHGPPRLVAV
jgi:hypothetical protein